MARLRKSSLIKRALAADSINLFSNDGTMEKPPVFSVEPERLFARDALLEVELGSGTGDFIIERAAALPQHNFLAVELSQSVIRLLVFRAKESGLRNLKVVRADARPLVNFLLPPACVSIYHIYFPDPWPKKRHEKHRLVSDHFVRGLIRTLTRDGMLFVASDVADYAKYIFLALEEAGFSRIRSEVPGAGISKFAKKYEADGRRIYAASFGTPGLPILHGISGRPGGG
jgi:tRNA (guanine-N7-)-methyltransferase